MEKSLSRICVIVGAGQGISQSVAARFGREGYIIALVARRQSALDEYAAELAAAGIEARGYAADAGDAASLKAAFAQIVDQHGAPEVLVYNAAAVHEGPPSAFDAEAVFADLRVNLGGAILSVGEVLPAMRQNRRGTILLTGGGLALRPSPAYASLAIGKAALRSYALSLSQELEAEGIHAATVTVAGFVQPGTYFDPAHIAEVYWTLHTQLPGAWDREVVYARSES